MKRFMERMLSLTPWICVIIETVYAQLKNRPILGVPSEDSFHFSLITVTAVFGGFLYTNYSLLVGLLDNQTVEKLRNTDIMHKRSRHIYVGIIYSTLSVIAGLLLILLPYNQGIVYNVLLNIEITFMAFVIIHFLLSLKEMNNLVKKIHKPVNKKSAEELEKIKNNIRLKS